MNEAREIRFTEADVDLIKAGKKTVARFPMDIQPPEEFCTGDVAGITNGPLWAISISKLDARGPKAWPPGNEPGFPCPFGVEGDVVKVVEQDTKLRIKRVGLEMLNQVTLGDICDEGLAESMYEFKPVQVGFEVFEKHWDEQYGEGAYEKNPWVWVLDLEEASAKH